MRRNFIIASIFAMIGSTLFAQKPVECPSLGVDLTPYMFLAQSTSDDEAMFVSTFFVLKEDQAVKLLEEKRMEGKLIGTTLYHFPLSAFDGLSREDFAAVIGFGEKEFDYAQLTFNFNTEAGVTRIPHNCESNDEPYDPMAVDELEFYLASPVGFETFLKLIGKN